MPFTPPQIDKTRWTNARVLAVDVRVAPAAAAVLLPPSLAAADPPMATVFVADYPEGILGIVYREAAVLLHARDAQGPAIHCPWMVVDDDAALIQGRELLGFPKKMAEIMLDEEGNRVVGRVVRKGVELLRIEAEAGEATTASPLFGRRFVNALGSIVTGMRLVDFTPTETFRSCRRATARVTLRSSAWDPGLGELEPALVGPGQYAIMDFGGGGAPPVVGGDIEAGWVMARFIPRSM